MLPRTMSKRGCEGMSKARSRVLLDTNVIIHLSTLGVVGFSARTRGVLEDENIDRVVCSISISEIAVKASLNKLQLTTVAMDEALLELEATLLPYTAKHARLLFTLPYHHRDPFDRMLICVALEENIPVVTSDKSFSLYEGLTVIS